MVSPGGVVREAAAAATAAPTARVMGVWRGSLSFSMYG